MHVTHFLISTILTTLLLPIMNSDQAVLKAKQRLSQSLAVEEAQISLQAVSSVQWPDSSLGCPQPGMMYTQVITDGYKVILELKNKSYSLHVGAGRAVLCSSNSEANNKSSKRSFLPK